MLIEYGKSCVDVSEESKPIKDHILEITHGSDEHSFLIGDLGDIIRNYNLWKKCLPRVHPYYAVKANNLYPVMKLLADMGLSFDCASKAEIQNILSLGVDPSRIIYANTFKQVAFIKYASDNNVSLMTFDCENELRKIKTVLPTARLVLRIHIEPNYKVKYPLGKKFGCQDVRGLLQIAKELQMNVVGICFHVGSQLLEATAFETAISQARLAFDIGLQLGLNMTLLDIGGGFPRANLNTSGTDVPFEKIADTVNKALDRYFRGNDIRVIAEPGRYFVSSAFTLATNILTKKICYPKDGSEETERSYIINDGIYGSFQESALDPGCHVPLHFKDDKTSLYTSTIWGPTCDSRDLVIANYRLPDLEQGEWIYFKNMGAYSVVMHSEFNSIPKAKQHFICEQKKWEEVYKP